jgi:Ni/Fe-hydrogenase subunit HybB-like protein
MKMNDRMNGFLWGFAVAAVVVPIGLSKGFGWYSAGQAQVFARQEAQMAMVKALTPFCVANFQKAADASEKLVALKKISSQWQRETFVRENKWALIGKDQDSGVIDACAAELYKL